LDLTGASSFIDVLTNGTALDAPQFAALAADSSSFIEALHSSLTDFGASPLSSF
jgi:hypothetical protein